MLRMCMRSANHMDELRHKGMRKNHTCADTPGDAHEAADG